ncbi:MAG: hypothetical protein LBI45_02120 [Bacteroidales bacterium]|jgi:hypothetical protein|nr:hypothetical protein [Bacteroidales bacterium]
MAENIAEYVFSIKDKVSGALAKIKIKNEEQLAVWAKVQTQVNAASNTMQKCGISIGSIIQRIAALKAEKEWIPANNINAIRRSNNEIVKLENQIRRLESVNGGKLKQWFGNLKQSIPVLGMVTNPLVLMSAAFYKANQFISGGVKAWEEQAVAETKLAAVMRNTMGAGKDKVETIKKLTDEQQKLGVISSSVQLAGAQELSTYLTKKESMEKIMPVMNDMLAQQYGLNASQEQSAQIATMLGKVMDGQVGALSRYGYKFDKAQEKILKHGTEAQRAAVLYNVVGSAVGGVNEALAKTPEGKLKQQANNLESIQARFGKLRIHIKNSLSPAFDSFQSKLETIVSWLEENKEKIIQIISAIVTNIKKVANIIGKVLGFVVDGFGWLWDKLKAGDPIITGVAYAIGTLGAAMMLITAKAKIMALWNGICTTATWLWAAASNALNLSLLANPITWIIAGIIALIGVIAYLCYKIEGWGSLWDGIIGFMKYGFLAYVESIKLCWSTWINTFMIGLDKIQLGWYKFKEAIGLGNSEENQKAIAEINASVENRKKAITDGAKKVADYAQKAKDSLANISMSWNSEKSLSDITSGIKKKLGFGENPIPGVVDLGAASDKGGVSDFGGKAEATATGGTRSTTININMGKFFDNIVFNGGFSENAKDIERKIEECLLRVLYSAQNTG